MMPTLLRYGLFPLMFLGGNALGISLIVHGAPLWQRLMALLAAIGIMFLAEPAAMES